VNTQQQLIDKLHDLIKHGDDVDRCYAIRSLATIHAPHSNDVLIECLRDDDIDVCVDAAEALGKLGGESAAEKLLESLMNDPDGEIKTACIRALAELGDKNTIPHFIAMAEQRPDNISFDDNEWDVWWDMQMESIKALGTLKVRDAIPAFHKIIEQDDYLDIENELYKAAAQIGHEGDELLLSLLESGNGRARRRVIKALGNSSSQTTLKPLARALQDEDPEIRSAALQALPHRQHAILYLPVMLHLLKDSDAAVRRAAVAAVTDISAQGQLNENAPEQASLVQKLLPLLADADAYVQSSVIDTLLQLNWTPDNDSSDQIISLLGSSEGDCFSSVCRFISTHRLRQALPDLRNLFKKRALSADQKARALACIGDLGLWDTQLETLLGTQLFDDTKSVRLSALETLAKLDKNREAESQNDQAEQRQPIDMIVEALQGNLQAPASLRTIPVTTTGQKAEAPTEQPTPDTPTREEDQQKIESSQAVFASESEEGKALLDNAFKEIRESIEEGETPQPMSTLDSMAITCVEHQIKAAADLPADDASKETATLSDEDKEELKEFLALSEANAETANWLFSKEKVSLDVNIQRLAARMIGFAGSAQAIPSLLQVCEQSDDVALKREVILSLGKLIEHRADLPSEQAESLQSLISASLQDKDRGLRIAAARTLGRLGDESDIPLLLAGFEDSEVAMRVQCLNSIQALLEANDGGVMNYAELAEQILFQFDNNEIGIHRAAIDALMPLLENKLNGNAQSIRETAIDRLITAGLAGSDGQVREMSQGMNALDKILSSTRLLARLNQSDTSIERRYLIEMLAELHRPAAA